MEFPSRTIRVNDVELHFVDAGPSDGPLVVLLHGFPDFWWGWRHQIEPLARRGFRVVVPDMRGYNLSGKPRGVGNYALDTLAADVLELAGLLGGSTFDLTGHDWGGIIAWHVAALFPRRVRRLVVLNAPHPDVFPRYMRRHPTQALRSLYAAWFQLPFLPEAILRARRFALLRRSLVHTSRSGFNAPDLDRYVEAWQQAGALPAMINYYRAFARRPWKSLARIESPTLIIWGERDPFLEIGVARASLKRCNNAQSRFVDAGHWVQWEQAQWVNETLVEFFAF